MAKPGLTAVNISTDTFQGWVDLTNEVVTIMQTDVMTASSSGDSTTGNATLVGTFTANTIIGFDNIRTDVIRPKTSSGSISIDTTINIASTTSQNLQTLTNSNGPRTRYATGSATWDVGYDNSSTNDFIIDSSQAGSTTTLRLSTTGDLTIPGTLQAAEFVGVVTGTVSSLGNFTTDDLDEGSTNQYYTSARAIDEARDAVGIEIPSNGLTYNSSDGLFGLSQNLGTSGEVTFKSLKLQPQAASDSASDCLIYSTSVVDSENSLILRKGPDDTVKISRTGTVNTTYILGLARVADHPDNGSMLGNLIVSSATPSQGNIIATGDITAFGSVSDERKKHNVVRITDALDKVSKIGGYTYNYLNDNRKMTGVIAQELLEVLPEAVYETEDLENNSTQYAVRHGNIVGLLIEAIKELQAEVEELKSK